MFKKKVIVLLFLLILIVLKLPTLRFATAQTEEEKLKKLSQEIEQYENELKRLQSQANTLSNQIAQYDAQIRLTTLKIEQTQEKINLLGGRIERLESSLSSLIKAFASRAVRTYKMTRISDPFVMLFTSTDLESASSSFFYLRKIQEADRDLLVRLKNVQGIYQEEKNAQEKLQNELQDQKEALAVQKAAKGALLAQTRNDEKRYQQLLAAARSEYEAIQAIIAGKGIEERVGNVSQGERIASIIEGPSCNSSGRHLHFIVRQNGTTYNPFNYLRSGIDYENCSGPSCGTEGGDPFNPSGSWDWPISPKIKFTQGYGSTWAIRNTWVGKIYQFHNGIDIDSYSSSEVRAVKSGTLYRGSYSGSNGCRLRYVRVDHDDSDLDTLYLHINY